MPKTITGNPNAGFDNEIEVPRRGESKDAYPAQIEVAFQSLLDNTSTLNTVGPQDLSNVVQSLTIDIPGSLPKNAYRIGNLVFYSFKWTFTNATNTSWDYRRDYFELPYGDPIQTAIAQYGSAHFRDLSPGGDTVSEYRWMTVGTSHDPDRPGRTGLLVECFKGPSNNEDITGIFSGFYLAVPLD